MAASSSSALTEKAEHLLSAAHHNSELNFNCANCDIKFDSESSLRVHLQVSLPTKEPFITITIVLKVCTDNCQARRKQLVAIDPA